MMSIAKLSVGHAEYYIVLQATDYYTGGGEPPGYWIGEGCEHLGLSGEVQKEAFTNVFNGLSPDGTTPLRQRQKYVDPHAGCDKIRQRQVGWDAVLSCPKPASLLAGLGPPELRRAFENVAMRRAVARTVEIMQEHIAFTRRGQGGKRLEPAKLIIAAFPHSTSRAMDPQFHVHLVVMNACVRDDGTTGALDSRLLYEKKMVLGAVFRFTLAEELEKLGFRCEPDRHGFKIEGIPSELCDHFSKRRKDIMARLAELGQESAIDAAYAALTTRKGKSKVPPREQLLHMWQAEAAYFGFTPDLIEEARKPQVSLQRDFSDYPEVAPPVEAKPSDATRPVAQAVDANAPAVPLGSDNGGDGPEHHHFTDTDWIGLRTREETRNERDFSEYPDVAPIVTITDSAIEEAVARRGLFTCDDVLPHVLDASIGTGLDLEAAIAATRKQLNIDKRCIRIAPPAAGCGAVYTTRQIMDKQRQIAAQISRGQSDRSFIVPDEIVRSVIDSFSRPRMPVAAELKYHASALAKAARRKKTRSINRPLLREHAAQTLDGQGRALMRNLTRARGRVTVISHASPQRNIALSAAVKAWQKAGYGVIACSRSRKDTHNLEQLTGALGMTHRELQLRMHPTFGHHVRHFAKQFVRAARKRRTFRLDYYRIDSKKIVILDRAEELSLEELSRLTRDVERQGGKLVLLTRDIRSFRDGRTNATALVLHRLSNSINFVMDLQHECSKEWQMPAMPQHHRPNMGMQP